MQVLATPTIDSRNDLPVFSSKSDSQSVTIDQACVDIYSNVIFFLGSNRHSSLVMCVYYFCNINDVKQSKQLSERFKNDFRINKIQVNELCYNTLFF